MPHTDVYTQITRHLAHRQQSHAYLSRRYEPKSRERVKEKERHQTTVKFLMML